MKKLIPFLLLLLFSTLLVFGKENKKEKFTYVKMKTTQGEMVLKLYNETPKHRDNMIALVKSGFYDSLLFHRVIRSFMIQGGDPQSKDAVSGQMLGNGDAPNIPRVPAEFNSSLYHKKGALAAARDNNPAKESSNCQFYIVQGKTFSDEDLSTMEKRNGWIYTAEQRAMYRNIGGTPHLDNNYTVYGELVAGMEVLDAIEDVKVGQANRPVTDVRIIKATVLKKYKIKKPKKEANKITEVKTDQNLNELKITQEVEADDKVGTTDKEKSKKKKD